ncbi:HypC/HybG/HupF family hydrogenase formation chaperone [Tropicimonas sp.]|uniref:HypC/HybG/HupF family hydrogenase formation chaperone n=1 Tax=Tropicimonas sp. TaxID=2067044 RepID=UPI003A86A010
MCIGKPMRIISVDGVAAQATDGEREYLIDLSLTGPLAPGTHVLTFLGAAREVIGKDEAARIAEALAALQRIMAGGEAGDAFADIEQRGPQLPPHLARALADGCNRA